MLKQVGLIASGEFYKTEVRERAKESVENFESGSGLYSDGSITVSG